MRLRAEESNLSDPESAFVNEEINGYSEAVEELETPLKLLPVHLED